MRETRKLPPDFALFVVTMILFAIGILLVFDASYAMAGDMKSTGGDSWYFVKRQLAFGIIGLLAMFGLMRVRLDSMRAWSVILTIVSIGLLAALLVPGVGVRVNGAVRWFSVGPVRFQPSEMAKFSLVLYLAWALSRQRFRIRAFGAGMILHLSVIGIIAGLALVEPDMGTACLIAITAFVMLCAAGALTRHLFLMAGAGAAGAALLVIVEPYRFERLLTFWNPMRDYFGSGYQVCHSLVALGSGRLFGVGLCEGREKFYLPAAQTDYIFPTLAEEAGLIGSLAVVALFLIFTYRGLSVANRAKNPYYALLAVGLTSMISIQALMNIAVVTASMPATGVPLPFLSYGGSSLLFTLMAAGLLLNISQNVHISAEQGFKEDEDYSDGRRDRRTHISRSRHSRSSSGREPRSRTAVHR